MSVRGSQFVRRVITILEAHAAAEKVATLSYRVNDNHGDGSLTAILIGYFEGKIEQVGLRFMPADLGKRGGPEATFHTMMNDAHATIRHNLGANKYDTKIFD